MKRSSSIALVMIGTSAIALSACDDNDVEAEIYSSLGECVQQSEMTDSDCRHGYLDARRQHADVAPKFASKQECEAAFGAGNCESAPQQSSGGSLFMPLMMGYMLGSMTSAGHVTPQPLYRTAGDPQTFRTADNKSVGRSTGVVRVASAAASQPSTKTTTVSRGGFGSTARYAGSATG